MTLPETSLAQLARSHRALLLDAYGVLVDESGPLPHAAEAIAWLHREGVAFRVLTNDASRLPETMRARFVSFGMDIPAAAIVSSGALLAPYFTAHGLVGARAVVLGVPDAKGYVERAGGVVVEPDPDAPADVLVVSDTAGYPFLETLDQTLSMLFRAIDAGRVPKLVLPNPDLIYPRGQGLFGVTAGAVAVVLEAALAQRYPRQSGLTFDRLGKPHTPVFDAACASVGTRDVVMIGDQLATDIAGAARAGLASALVTSGTVREEEALHAEHRPTWLLRSLQV